MDWSIKRFGELSTDELHDLLDLRIRVFVVEQNCPYPEIDGKDRQSAHVIGRDESGEVVAYSRIVDPGISYPEPGIGRVVTAESIRGRGVGHDIMTQSMHHVRENYGQVPVKLSAQEHLRSYYNKHGFQTVSDTYEEDSIPHIEMLYLPGTDPIINEDVVKSRRRFYAQKWQIFENAQLELQDWLSKWTDEELSYHPKSGGWTASQVVDHIITSEKGTIGYMLKKTQAEPEVLPYLAKEDRDKAFKLIRRLQSNERYEAPSALPSPDDSKAFSQLTKEWGEMRDHYRHFLATLSTDYYGRFIFRHPFTGPMSVEETLGFLIEHIGHHKHQLDRIYEEVKSNS